VRVTALSATLIRIEPVGPNGFEDNATFMVRNRAPFMWMPITATSRTSVSPSLQMLTTPDLSTRKSNSPLKEHVLALEISEDVCLRFECE
jgi:hypothetical protein